MRNIMVAGGGGREAAFAKKIAEDARLYAVMPHENPVIIQCATGSGGAYKVGDPGDPQVLADYASSNGIDLAFVNADGPLANGAIDALAGAGIACVGGTKEASRIEWDKAYAMDMMYKTFPRYTPRYRIIRDESRIADAIEEFKSDKMNVAVKPQGLTGGKGVRVMPEHLPGYADCAKYAAELLRRGAGNVILVEGLEGAEFTIMGITDGRSLVMAPASYDYPFRYDGDSGPGTGGMGCITFPDHGLPFLDDGDLEECRDIMQGILDGMRAQNMRFSGVINGGFFKTARGIRFMEFNARFGDPEALNVLAVLNGSFSGLLGAMSGGRLDEHGASFARKATVSKYLVGSKYPGSGAPEQFGMDYTAIDRAGLGLYTASCVMDGYSYRTLGASRVAALVAVSDTIQEASQRIDAAISNHTSGGLEHRRDIGIIPSKV